MPSRNRVSSVSLCRSTIRARRGAAPAAAVAAPTFGTTTGHGVATKTALILGLALGLGACSSSNDEKFASFVGTWRFDPTSSFALSCSGQSAGSVTLWKDFVIEEGTVSDLIETSGACQFMFDVNGQTASLTTPDPLTGNAPSCLVSDDSTDSAGNDVTDSVMIVPTPGQWALTLGAAVKGQAPKASLNGGAQWTQMHTVGTAAPQTLSCTYLINATMTKISNGD